MSKASKNPPRWDVAVIPPHEDAISATVPLDRWLAQFADGAVAGRRPDLAWEEFYAAFEVAARHDAYRGPMVEQPRIGYDIVHNCEYFLFAPRRDAAWLVVRRKRVPGASA